MVLFDVVEQGLLFLGHLLGLLGSHCCVRLVDSIYVPDLLLLDWHALDIWLHVGGARGSLLLFVLSVDVHVFEVWIVGGRVWSTVKLIVLLDELALCKVIEV